MLAADRGGGARASCGVSSRHIRETVCDLDQIACDLDQMLYQFAFRFDENPLTIASRDNGGGEDQAGDAKATQHEASASLSVPPQATPRRAYGSVVGAGFQPALQRKEASK